MTKPTAKEATTKPKKKKPLAVNKRTMSVRERIENIKAQQAWDKEWENDK
ncbi:hypothetical protein VXS03_02395 [Photobacterium sp. S4TG1]|nr:hypothetical protein [Photobacterium sp. S4TG1]